MATRALDATIDPAAPEARFSDAADDALTRAQRALGLIPPQGEGLARRIALAVGLCWLPLVVFAFWQRRLLPGSVPEPLLEHFSIHARFLVALPLLIVAEATTRASLRQALPQFLSRGLVAEDDVPAFRAILERAYRLRGSRAVLMGLLALVLLASAIGWSRLDDLHELSWATGEGGRGVSFGAAWFSFVSRPLFLLALVVWLWRLGIIGWAFAQIARLDLRLAPTHPDRAGGLGFLERLPSGFAPLFLALSVPIAGHWAHDALYHGLDVKTLRAPALALLVVNALVAAAPMLAFAPRLLATRHRALAAWGALLAEHGRRVERRWIHREEVGDDGLLSAPELGPVADTVSLYDAVSRMRSAPIARTSLVAPLLATAIPLIPVFATQVPLKEILRKLVTGLIGV